MKASFIWWNASWQPRKKIGEIEQLTAEDTTDPEERMRRIRELSRSLLKEW